MRYQIFLMFFFRLSKDSILSLFLVPFPPLRKAGVEM